MLTSTLLLLRRAHSIHQLSLRVLLLHLAI